MNVITNTAARAKVPRAAVPAHGGRLVERLVNPKDAVALVTRAIVLPVALDARTPSDAELIAPGVLSPLEGFVGRRDDYSIFTNIRLSGKSAAHVFSIPITLSVPSDVLNDPSARRGSRRAPDPDGGNHVQA
jgi:ATP sulfurylase